MVHIGRPHTSLPYAGGGDGGVELPDIGNTALLGTDNTGDYGAYPLAAVIVALLASSTQSEARGAIDAVNQTAVDSAISTAVTNLVGAAPAAYDTLKEIADKLSSDDTALAAINATLIGKQPLHATLTALAALTLGTNKLLYVDGTGALAVADLTAAGRAVLDDADTTAQRATLGVRIGQDVQAYDAELAALAGLTSAANKLAYFTGSGTAALADITAAGRALIDDADASTQLTTLGVSTFIKTLLDDPDAATALATLGARIGIDVQAYDAELAALASLTSGADKAPYFTGSGTASTMTVTAAARNLLDDATVNDMIATLGLNIASENPQTGTTYTLALTDFNKTVTMNNAAANTVTIPPNSTVPFPVNSVVNLASRGAGQTTIAPGAGVTIRSNGSKLKLTGQYSAGAAWKIDTDEWLIFGDLST